jgi:hypothetical protein
LAIGQGSPIRPWKSSCLTACDRSHIAESIPLSARGGGYKLAVRDGCKRFVVVIFDVHDPVGDSLRSAANPLFLRHRVGGRGASDPAVIERNRSRALHNLDITVAIGTSSTWAISV